MKVIRVKNQEEGAQMAFTLLKEKIAAGAKTLGLATGSTPLAFYQKIADSDLDFSEMRSINLDEYLGLAADNPQSYHYFMEKNVFIHKPFKESFLPDGRAEDIDAEISRYNRLLEQYPIDFQILGLGQNGHIGFNEPGTSFDSQTHLVDLTQETIQANARFFADQSEVPHQALSMGIASIMSAKTLVLMAYGQQKAEAAAKMINGPVTEELPASILQRHADAFVILDEVAASLL
ncbi:glucosamine-6-phosphate deaminase [Streptococcus chenjunshii]|uniref:Glucosamine-6-phosphate deaminase n=1 Tax=Streptococcus chenjunshii TaxID=2173853 RepID=A0A372KKR2_9STRE|nr:glucosamine-6-phosphate deaminase [Streptococcus chenjunshii]AXQ78287.1 glucosamine-6-phosphate deaminase [Streptococcus chenjunshii]RFU50734.1 glucosamine-6-phosphate deaminase [Streptococcus chenjunshii]RFU52865.1 glucosamine-6-phosphate deaminase [Streptococcus chenjunshii]